MVSHTKQPINGKFTAETDFLTTAANRIGSTFFFPKTRKRKIASETRSGIKQPILYSQIIYNRKAPKSRAKEGESRGYLESGVFPWRELQVWRAI